MVGGTIEIVVVVVAGPDVFGTPVVDGAVIVDGAAVVVGAADVVVVVPSDPLQADANRIIAIAAVRMRMSTPSVRLPRE